MPVAFAGAAVLQEVADAQQVQAMPAPQVLRPATYLSSLSALKQEQLVLVMIRR